MPNNVIELVVKATDKATGPLRAIAGKIGAITAAGLATGAILAAVKGIRAVVAATIEAEKATAQLDAAFKATGGGLGRTRKQLDDLATSVQNVTTLDDDLVKSAESVLLTFDRVRGEAFERTIRVAADLSARLGTDLTSAVRTVGFALQDPEQGLTRLRRAGISFSDAQKEVVKHLIETGKSAEAQNLILQALETRFKGAAAAARNTLGGAVEALHVAFNNLLEGSTESTEGVIKAVNSMTTALQDPQIKESVDAIKSGIFGIGAAALESVGKVGLLIDNLQRMFGVGGNALEDIEADLEAARSKLEAVQAPHRIFIFGVTDSESEESIKRRIALLEQAKTAAMGLSNVSKQGRVHIFPAPAEEDQAAIDAYNAKMAELRLKIEQLQPVTVTAQKIITDYGAMFRDTATSIEKATHEAKLFEIQLRELLHPANGSAPRITGAEFNARINETLQPVVVTAQKIKAKTDEVFGAISASGEQAFKNIETAMADFFFDPFSDGLDGMLLGFVNLLRRMVAEILAAQVMEKLFKGGSSGFGDWLAKIFGAGVGAAGGAVGAGAYGGNMAGGVGPHLAGGGYIPPGGVATVGESGRELAFGGRYGKTIVPMSGHIAKDKPSNITYAPHTTVQVDSRADREAVRQDTMMIVQEGNRQMLKFIVDQNRRGGLRG